MASDTVDGYISAIKVLRSAEAHYRITIDAANVIMPAAAPGENEGEFVNGEGRAQRFAAAVPPPGEARPSGAMLRQRSRKSPTGASAKSSGMGGGAAAFPMQNNVFTWLSMPHGSRAVPASSTVQPSAHTSVRVSSVTPRGGSKSSGAL